MSFDIIYGIVSTLIFIAILIFIGVKYKQEDEHYYPLFIFLYYFIGASKLILFMVPIPLGFLICIIYLHSKPQLKNRRAKKAAITLGIVAFLMGCIIPFARTQILTSTKTLNVTDWSVKGFHFTQEYKAVMKSLGPDALYVSTPTVTSFQVFVDKNDNIKELTFTLHFSNGVYQDVNVQNEPGISRKLYIHPTVQTQSNNQAFMFGSTVTQPSANAQIFFGTLDNVTLEKMEYPDATENLFVLQTSLSYPDGEKPPAEVYLIDGSNIHRVADSGQTGNILVCGGQNVKGNDKYEEYKNYLPFP